MNNRSEALRLGIIGTASIADRIVEGARRTESVAVTAVAGRDANRTRAWASERGIPEWFEGYESMLLSGAIDAVYIPLPNSLHAEWTVRALRAGLPVLCEKPAVTTLSDADAVRRESIRTGLPVVEAFMYRHHPLWDAVRTEIAEGAVGRVVTIDSRFSWPCDDPGAVCARSELHGGALFDVGCYCVHASRLLAGCEPSGIRAFCSRGFVRGTSGRDTGGENGAGRFGPANGVDDTLVGIMEFPSGVLSHFETGLAQHERHGMEITGTTGLIRIERPWVQGDSKTMFTVETESGCREVSIPPADAYALELESFEKIVAKCRLTGQTDMDSLNDLVGQAAAVCGLLRDAGTGPSV